MLLTILSGAVIQWQNSFWTSYIWTWGRSLEISFPRTLWDESFGRDTVGLHACSSGGGISFLLWAGTTWQAVGDVFFQEGYCSWVVPPWDGGDSGHTPCQLVWNRRRKVSLERDSRGTLPFLIIPIQAAFISPNGLCGCQSEAGPKSPMETRIWGAYPKIRKG